MASGFGNLPLGQVHKLLISIIGRDASLAIAEEHSIFIIGKDLDRVFAEEDKSFVHHRPSEETCPLKIVRKFFEIAEKPLSKGGYEFPDYIKLLVIDVFFKTFQNALLTITPYETQTKDTVLHLLNWLFLYLDCGIKDAERDKTHFIPKNSLSLLLNDTYDNIFNDVYINLNIKKEQFYEFISEIYKKIINRKEKQKNYPDDIQALKRVITKCCKNDTNEPWIGEKGNWYKFKAILDYIIFKGEKELVHRLIGLYLLKNTEAALKDICGIDQKDIYNIKQDILLWANDKLPNEPKPERQAFLKNAKKITEKLDLADLSLLQEHSIDPLNTQKKALLFESGVDLWGKTAIDPFKIEQLIKKMEENFPNCKVFFALWARARLAVLSYKFNESDETQKIALKYYHDAFDKGRNFAGESLKAFLEESIAAAVYFNRRRIQDIPKVINPSEPLKTPITDDVKGKENCKASYGAKQYYEYGYALNLFEQESSETYFLHFHAEEHFWKVFQVHQFVYTKLAEQKRSEDILKSKGIHFIGKDKEDLKRYSEIIKYKLENITENNINHRMEINSGHNIQYTPLSIALQRGEFDIAEHYLNDIKTLDITVINTHGSTALLEALTQYKNCRLLEKSEQSIERYKKIILELIKRSPIKSLYAETKKSYIQILYEAINCFDIEIVKAIIEKEEFIKKDNKTEKRIFDIKNIKISADEFSPLYYAVNRLFLLDQVIFNGNIDKTNVNINWTKLNVPGIYMTDKQSYMENLKNDPLYHKAEQLSLLYNFGKSSVWEQEYEDINKIIHYLIEKTDDVDDFIKKMPNGDCTNVLSLAVEADFVDICRLLIEKGANPACIFTYNGKPYDSPFMRIVWYKSWKTLEMLLIEFKDRIKQAINERFREEQQTAAHLLFKVDNNLAYRYEINQNNIKSIEYFIPLLHTAGAEFNIPDHNNITVRQILERGNKIHLIL